MKRWLLLFATLAFIAAADPARAQAPAEPFPARLVKVVVAWPPEGFVRHHHAGGDRKALCVVGKPDHRRIEARRLRSHRHGSGREEPS